MNPYITQFKKQLADYEARYGNHVPVPILELLWRCYCEENPVDDGQIRQAELALKPVFEALPTKESDMLFDRITELVIVYQHAAFLSGVHIGAHLAEELSEK